MVKIVPAVLAATAQAYSRDLEVAASVSMRIQIDMVDGKFADNRTINLSQVYWLNDLLADLHLMYHHPEEQLPMLIAMAPHLAIVHVEADGIDTESIGRISTQLRATGIKFGVALLPQTPVAAIEANIDHLDHVLIFTGELGHYGGDLDESCLVKIGQVKQLKTDIEVGVDGGINPNTIEAVLIAGADVLNVGGYIQNADDAKAAYAKLEAIASQTTVEKNG